jgi:4-hydroxybenzoate polyprenyltransferase
MLSLRQYFEFVRFSHTVFALPFALAAMVVAARAERGWPGGRVFLLILVAMVCARTAAMGFNRIVDRKFDARNPRTAGRHLPVGQMSVTGAWWLVIGAAVGLVVVSALINRLCFALAPVALAIVLVYSVTKRFTDFTHFFLGLALAVAPVGAWLAVRGTFDWPPVVLALAVVFWLAGFDIIYATQDFAADKAQGLHSLPVRWGIAGSLRFARWAHAVMWAVLVGFGLISDLRLPYYAGLAVIGAGLVYEHWLAGRGDPVSVNVASLRVNGVISVVFLVSVVADTALR